MQAGSTSVTVLTSPRGILSPPHNYNNNNNNKKRNGFCLGGDKKIPSRSRCFVPGKHGRVWIVTIVAPKAGRSLLFLVAFETTFKKNRKVEIMVSDCHPKIFACRRAEHVASVYRAFTVLGRPPFSFLFFFFFFS